MHLIDIIQNDFHWLNDLRRENNKNCKFILGDIRDQDSVLNAMKDCDAVIHLAALLAYPIPTFLHLLI